MIFLTRLNGTHFYVNAEMIQFVEGTPDTVITLTDKSKLVVKESADVVVERFIAYQRQTKSAGWAVGQDDPGKAGG